MRTRLAVLVSLTLVALVAAAVLLSGESGSGDDPPSPLALREDTSSTTTSTLTPAQQTANNESLDAVASAVGVLLDSGSVQVAYEGQDENTLLEGSVTIDLATGNYHSEETESHGTGAVVSSEHVLVGDTLYVRFKHSEGSIEDIEFSPVELVAGRQEFVDETLTMTGRAGASLERIVRYLDEVPFTSTSLGSETVGDGPATGYQISFEAAAISEFLRSEDLELVGPSDPEGQTIYEFWIDDVDSHLAKIAVGGVHFQDGEALDGFGGEIFYKPGDQVAISIPDRAGPAA